MYLSFLYISSRSFVVEGVLILNVALQGSAGPIIELSLRQLQDSLPGRFC
jgi:hypothetical protein